MPALSHQTREHAHGAYEARFKFVLLIFEVVYRRVEAVCNLGQLRLERRTSLIDLARYGSAATWSCLVRVNLLPVEQGPNFDDEHRIVERLGDDVGDAAREEVRDEPRIDHPGDDHDHGVRGHAQDFDDQLVAVLSGHAQVCYQYIIMLPAQEVFGGDPVLRDIALDAFPLKRQAKQVPEVCVVIDDERTKSMP
jgi:hypothetical protein